MDHKQTDAARYGLEDVFTRYAIPDRFKSTLPPLSAITAVGAILDEEGALDTRDAAILRSTVTHLLATGIPVAPDFRYTPVNLKNGEDFLASQPPTDLLLLSYVFHPPSWLCGLFPSLSKPGNDNQNDPEKAAFLRTSPLKHFRDIWNKAALGSDARIVASYGMPELEATVRQLSPAYWHIPVRPGSTPYGESTLRSAFMSEWLYGFAVRKGPYLDALRDAVRAPDQAPPNTWLGKRLAHVTFDERLDRLADRIPIPR